MRMNTLKLQLRKIDVEKVMLGIGMLLMETTGLVLLICGIYGIKNTVNNKIYVGKSKNIGIRWKQHVYSLNCSSKDENRHLINAWHKYGQDCFECFVIEELELNTNSNFTIHNSPLCIFKWLV